MSFISFLWGFLVFHDEADHEVQEVQEGHDVPGAHGVQVHDNTRPRSSSRGRASQGRGGRTRTAAGSSSSSYSGVCYPATWSSEAGVSRAEAGTRMTNASSVTSENPRQ